MATQSAVRCVKTVSAGAVLPARRESARRMDAAACFQALELELSKAPIGTVQKGMAGVRLLKRAGIALVCSGLAVLIGSVAGMLNGV